MTKKTTHGGKRKNSGRKKLGPTVTMRVPKSLARTFKKLIKEHKANPGE